MPALEVNKQETSIVSRSTYENMEDFVRQSGGSRVIRRILIANNGNAAIKVPRRSAELKHRLELRCHLLLRWASLFLFFSRLSRVPKACMGLGVTS